MLLERSLFSRFLPTHIRGVWSRLLVSAAIDPALQGTLPLLELFGKARARRRSTRSSVWEPPRARLCLHPDIR